MNKIVNHLKNHRPLYFAIGFTLLFVVYILLVQAPFSSCFKLDVGSNSLGLAIYNTEMVQGFFQARDQAQLFCYSQFLQLWDVIFAVVSTAIIPSIMGRNFCSCFYCDVWLLDCIFL